MTDLFSSFKIRSLELKNRIVVSPMCQYSSTDGFANDWHLVHLGSRAIGGAGLIIAEATAVNPEGRITPKDLGIWKDEHIEFLKRITDFIYAHGSIAGIQLAHAGRKASKTEPWNGNENITSEKGGWEIVAPSPLPFSEGDLSPKSLSLEEIQGVVEDFKLAAIRAYKAGFKIVEIHAAHGYLIHEFLSPLSNQRMDEYGGVFENRIRILLEIVAGVRKVWPDNLPVFVRISATDWKEGGWDLKDSIMLSKILKTKGVDLIDCSSGGAVKDVKIPVSPGYQVPFAEAIKKETGIPTGAVGFITTAKQANEIIQKSQADLVFLAREFLRNPYFPLKASFDLEKDINWPVQYERAKSGFKK